MRLRIASDLHDELGSELSGIAFAAAAMGTESRLEVEQRQQLSEISRSARGVMEGLRDIVWYVSPHHDALASLADRMRSTARRLAPHLDCKFETPAELASELQLDQRRELHLAFKEVITNAVRHASATELIVRLRVDEGRLQIEVEDDGCGLAEADQADEHQGLGIASIRRRLAAIGGTASWSVGAGGKGTKVHLAVPLVP